MVERINSKDEVLPDSKPVGRNDPGPCGSGKKYKRCCCR
ncbi:SEC-C metal-binding domain-containing protein [Sporomusa sp.]